MQNDSGLPPHLTTRPLRHTDSRAVFELMAAHELDTVGEVAIEEADIIADWQRPSFDIESSTMGVFDGERLVAYGEHSRADRADAAVHPAYRGRGIGTWVAHWIVAKAAERGVPVVGMPVSAGSPGEVLLRGLGWRQRWESWILRLPEGVDIPAPPISPGYLLRAARADEYAAVHEVIEDAFLEWSARERDSFADFAATTVRRPGFEPWHLRVALGPDERVVGASLVMTTTDGGAYIDKLAVRRDERGKGLARALLAESLRQVRAHGHHAIELATDSRAGALGLYEHLGMVVTSRWINLAATTDS